MFALRLVWALLMITLGLFVAYKSWNSKKSLTLRFAGMFFGGLWSLVALAGILPNETPAGSATVATVPDDARKQYEEAEAAFKRMSPAEHLQSAKEKIRADSKMNELFDGR